eukprot:4603725-Prymnesium_polylepis.1
MAKERTKMSGVTSELVELQAQIWVAPVTHIWKCPTLLRLLQPFSFVREASDLGQPTPSAGVISGHVRLFRTAIRTSTCRSHPCVRSSLCRHPECEQAQGQSPPSTT